MKPKFIRLSVKLSVLLLVIYLVSVTARPSREEDYTDTDEDFEEDDDEKDDDDDDHEDNDMPGYSTPEFPALPSHVLIAEAGDETNKIQTLQSTVDYLEEFVRRFIAPHIDPNLPSDHFPDWLKKPSKPFGSEPNPALPTPAPEQVFIPPELPVKPKPGKGTKKPVPTEGVIIDKIDLHMGTSTPVIVTAAAPTATTTVAPNVERSTIATESAIPEPAPAPPMELQTPTKPVVKPDVVAPVIKPESSVQVAQTLEAKPAVVEQPAMTPKPEMPKQPVAETAPEMPATPMAEIPSVAKPAAPISQEPAPVVFETPAAPIPEAEPVSQTLEVQAVPIVETPLPEPTVAEIPASPMAELPATPTPEVSSMPIESAPAALEMSAAPMVEAPLPVVSEMTSDTMMTQEPVASVVVPSPEIPIELMSEMATAEAMAAQEQIVEPVADIKPESVPEPSTPALETPVEIPAPQEPPMTQMAAEKPAVPPEATGIVDAIVAPAPVDPVLTIDELSLPDLEADLPPSEPVVGLGEAVEHPTINLERIPIATEAPETSVPLDQPLSFDPNMAELYPPPIMIGSESIDPMMMKIPEDVGASAQLVMPPEGLLPIPMDPAYLESIKPSDPAGQMPTEAQPELLSGVMGTIPAEAAPLSETMAMEPEPAVDAPHDHVDTAGDTAVPLGEFPKEPAIIQMLLLEENVHPLARGLPTERKETPVLTCHNCTIRISCTDCVKFRPDLVLTDPSAFPMTITTPGLEITADPNIHAILANYSEMFPETRATVFEMNNVEATFDGNQVTVEAAPAEPAPASELASMKVDKPLIVDEPAPIEISPSKSDNQLMRPQAAKVASQSEMPVRRTMAGHDSPIPASELTSIKVDKPLVVDEPAPIEISPSQSDDRLMRPQAAKVASQSAMPVRRTMAGHDSPIRAKRAIGLILHRTTNIPQPE